jgi:tetratricopeptide (TPR) repeat protein
MTSQMTCDEIEQGDVMERYLLGRLDEASRDEVDEHLFTCDACFERLQTLRALRRELAATVGVRGVEVVPEKAGWIWRWTLLPALAVLVVAIGVTLGPRAFPPSGQSTSTSPGRPDRPAGTPGQPSPMALAELGKFQPPAFAAASLRGVPEAATARFRDGMAHYARGDYRGAIAGLRAAAALDPQAAHATFFLGICHVLNGELNDGIRALQQTIDAGDSPYLEEAHLYLARTFLQNLDPIRARQEIERTIGLRGPLEKDARQLLADLDRLPTTTP